MLYQLFKKIAYHFSEAVIGMLLVVREGDTFKTELRCTENGEIKTPPFLCELGFAIQ